MRRKRDLFLGLLLIVPMGLIVSFAVIILGCLFCYAITQLKFDISIVYEAIQIICCVFFGFLFVYMWVKGIEKLKRFFLK